MVIGTVGGIVGATGGDYCQGTGLAPGEPYQGHGFCPYPSPDFIVPVLPLAPSIPTVIPTPPPTPTPVPTPTPTPAPPRAIRWTSGVWRDALEGDTPYAATFSTALSSTDRWFDESATAGRVVIACRHGKSLDAYVFFGDDAFISGNVNNSVETIYRLNGGDATTLWMNESTNNTSVFSWLPWEFAGMMLRMNTFTIRAFSWHDGEEFTASFRSNGATEDDRHPIRAVLEACSS